MPLILAIEPDRSQANELAAVVRGRLRAELILADAAEPALAELGDRIPDLILTSALLSTKDEAALADRLRKLDGAASHVQTLTIPMLHTPQRPSASGRGVLFARLTDRVSSPAAPDGCDPAVFAEQCAAYLERAVAERGGPVDDAPPAEPASFERDWAPHEEAVAVQDVIAADEHAPSEEDLPASAAPALPAAAAPAVAEAVEESVEIDLSGMLDEAVFQQLSEAIETVSRDSVRVNVPATPGGEAWTPSSLGSAAVWPAMNFTSGDGRRSHAPAPAPSLAKRFPERKPIQDEWGFFDPTQCGFSALLAKLDEITHVASSLPGADPSAGSPDVSR